jgi:hypothetical protein
VPELEFSLTEIMSLLLENRQLPVTALEDVQQGTTRTREEKMRVKRANDLAVT